VLSTILDVVVNVLHREVECLPLEAVVGGDLTDPVEEHQSHIGSELSLTAEDVQIRLLLLFVYGLFFYRGYWTEWGFLLL